MVKGAYQFASLVLVAFSLGNKLNKSGEIFTILYVVYGFCFLITIALSISYAAKPGVDWMVRGALMFIPASYLSMGVFYGANEFLKLLTCGVMYMFAVPTYVNVFAVYAFAN